MVKTVFILISNETNDLKSETKTNWNKKAITFLIKCQQDYQQQQHHRQQQQQQKIKMSHQRSNFSTAAARNDVETDSPESNLTQKVSHLPTLETAQGVNIKNTFSV